MIVYHKLSKRKFETHQATFGYDPFIKDEDNCGYKMEFVSGGCRYSIDFSDSHFACDNYIEIKGKQYHYKEMKENPELVAALIEHENLLSKIEALP